MRHDYPEGGHVNGAFAAVVLTLFLVGVCGVLAILAVVISR